MDTTDRNASKDHVAVRRALRNVATKRQEPQQKCERLELAEVQRWLEAFGEDGDKPVADAQIALDRARDQHCWQLKYPKKMGNSKPPMDIDIASSSVEAKAEKKQVDTVSDPTDANIESVNLALCQAVPVRFVHELKIKDDNMDSIKDVSATAGAQQKIEGPESSKGKKRLCPSDVSQLHNNNENLDRDYEGKDSGHKSKKRRASI